MRICVLVNERLAFFLPITVRCALASTGLAVLLLSNTSQTYSPVSEVVGAGMTSRRPLASRRPSRFHETVRLSTGLRGDERGEEKRGAVWRFGEKTKRVTEGNYNILNPSVHVSIRKEMNDDSLYIRAVSSTQHGGASDSYTGCLRKGTGFHVILP